MSRLTVPAVLLSGLVASLCAVLAVPHGAAAQAGPTLQTALQMAAAPPGPGHEKGAAQFVQGLGDRAIGILADPKVSDSEALNVFRALLTENFDVLTIGRFVAGRNWNSATEPERTEYTRLFETMIVEVYAQRFNQYAGETFKVTGSRAEGERDAIITSQVLRPSGPPVNVAWRVRSRDGTYRIVDVIVENVSMSVTQRSEFASVIDQNGGRFEALLNALRQRIQTAQAK